MRLVLIIVLFSITLLSCKKKDENDSVNGLVSDIADGHAVAGLTVEVQAKLIGTSTYQSSFSTVASGISDGSGAFSFTFPRQKAAAYRIRVSGTNYMATEAEFSPDLLSDGSHTQNIKIPAYGWITIRVINNYPTDDGDEATIKFINVPSGLVYSCSTDILSFEGAANDTIPVCFVPGGLHLIIEKNIHSGNNNYHSYDTVLIPVNDTLLHTVSY